VCANTTAALSARGWPLVVFADQNVNSSGNIVVLRQKGEVFEDHSCPTRDPRVVTVFRALAHDRECNWLHFLQFSFFLHAVYPEEERARFPQRQRTRAEALSILESKTEFAAFGFGKFRLLRYHGDYVARHVFVELLRRRNIGTVHALGRFAPPGFTHSKCPGSFFDMHKCLSPYRFAIVMENSNFAGYVSEKLLNAFLAESIPVYFGAEDVGMYFNERAMIICRLTVAETVILRAAHRGNYTELADKSEHAIVEWALSVVGPSLQSCVERVSEVAADDEVYVNMLMAHPLSQLRRERTYIDGFDTSCQLVRMLEASRPTFFARNHTRVTCQETLHSSTNAPCQ